MQPSAIFRKVYKGLALTPQQMTSPVKNACRVEMGIEGDRVQFDVVSEFDGLDNYVIGAGGLTGRDYIYTAEQLNRNKYKPVDLIMTPLVVPMLLQKHELNAAHLTIKAKKFVDSMKGVYYRRMINDTFTAVDATVKADLTNLRIGTAAGSAISLKFISDMRSWAGDNYLTGSNAEEGVGMGKLHAWATPDDYQSLARIGEASGRDFRPDAGGALYSGADTFYFNGIYWHELPAVNAFKGGTSDSKRPVFLWAEQGVGIGIGYDFDVDGPTKSALSPGWVVQGEGFLGAKVVHNGDSAGTHPAVAVQYVA